MPQMLLVLAGVLAVSPDAELISYEQDGSRMAAARVRNWLGGYQQRGPTVNGSGTLTAVDGDAGLVLTAAHLFEKEIGTVTVEFADGQSSGARILALNAKLDVAALWIYAPEGIEPVPLADCNPTLGDMVEIWGFGPKRFRSFAATVAAPIPLDGDPPRTLVGAQGIVNRQVTIPGDSGGPIIKEGRLVAVHWGYRGDENDPRRCVHALGCDRLRNWMKQELAPRVWRRCLVDPVRNVSMN